MPPRDIIVIGASAGGIEPLRRIIGGLPAELEAAVFVVLHVPATGGSVLPKILGRSAQLPVAHAIYGDLIRPGRVLVAPPDHHLILTTEAVRLERGPKQNGSRPAIDPIFRSAAETHGPRVIGVILSGTRNDGAAGLATVHACGGVTVVQSPSDALHAGMPEAAIELSPPDHVLPATEIAPLLVSILRAPAPPDLRGREGRAGEDAPVRVPSSPKVPPPPRAEIDPRTAQGVPSGYGCPECGGALFQLPGDDLDFRCRTGHGFGSDALLDRHSSVFEDAIWEALRVAKESAELTRRLAERAQSRGHLTTERLFRERYDEALARVHLMEDALRKAGVELARE